MMGTLAAVLAKKKIRTFQDRYKATVTGDKGAVRVCGLYLPNGNPAPGPKYDYKLAWMSRMEARARQLLAEEMPCVLAGDYNVIPQDEDCYDPKAWEGDALFRPESRSALRRLINRIGAGLLFDIMAARFGTHHAFFGKLVQGVAELP